jgi:hypothetical protein
MLRYCAGYKWDDSRSLQLKWGFNFCNPNADLPGCGAYGQWDNCPFDVGFAPLGYTHCGSCYQNGNQYQMTQCSSDGKSYVVVTYSDALCLKKVSDSGLISASPSGCGHKDACRSEGEGVWSSAAYYFAIEGGAASNASNVIV